MSRVGHPHEGGGDGAGGPSRDRAERGDAGGGAAGGDGLRGRDGADVGPADGAGDVDSDAPQEGRARGGVPSRVGERREVKGREYVFASASADNIKKWKCPEVEFLGNIGGHNYVLNTIAMNRQGLLFAGGDNGMFRFCDWKTGYCFQEERTVVQPGRNVRGVRRRIARQVSLRARSI